MKKDIEWFKKELDDIENNTPALHRHDAIWMLDRVHELYNQLDEPETLSQEWIDENKVARINNVRKMTTSDVVPVEKLKNLLVPKQDDGYDAEKEKLYQVELPTERLHHILTMHGDGKGHFFGKEHINNFWYRTHLTEQEIKAIDERFWAFAQEVTECN